MHINHTKVLFYENVENGGSLFILVLSQFLHLSLLCLVSCMHIDCEDHSSVFEHKQGQQFSYESTSVLHLESQLVIIVLFL